MVGAKQMDLFVFWYYLVLFFSSIVFVYHGISVLPPRMFVNCKSIHNVSTNKTSEINPPKNNKSPPRFPPQKKLPRPPKNYRLKRKTAEAASRFCKSAPWSEVMTGVTGECHGLIPVWWPFFLGQRYDTLLGTDISVS